MEVYLVGGAVRDQLLGLEVKERDWVVVGSTVEEMLALGYRPVGKDFPVFLHPETKEEYALARTERKVGRGYTGFTFYAAPEVTLVEDLQRRDLTINAIARDLTGELIDPYHGAQDLQARILRHVSAAFIEDPLRILRVARFAARYYDRGFTIANETLQLMQTMSTAEELAALSAERIWLETCKALATLHPEIYFIVLVQVQALPQLFASFAQLEPIIWQGALQHLSLAAALNVDIKLRWASLLQALAIAGRELAQKINTELSKRYKIASEYQKLAELAIEYVPSLQRLEQLSAQEIYQVLSKIDSFRKPERVEELLQLAEIDHRCLEPDQNLPYRPVKLLKKIFAQIRQINANAVDPSLSGKQIGEAIKQARIAVIANILAQ